MLKKTRSALVVSALLVAGAANAVVENGSLSFQWQGTTPAMPVVPATWRFVDALGASYTPTNISLNMVRESDGSLSVNSASNHSFFVAVDNGTLNTLDAYLGSNPTSTGLVASRQLALAATASPGVDQVAILMNGTPLRVGSANKVTAGGTGSQRSIDISLSAKIAPSSFTERTIIGVSAPVIFSVDIVGS
ncbi:hypothetical protein LDQ03_04970 [Aeromonas hydrophila]|uniref:hypothetical protein n=1 Tax=Aeromonas hydrophila TaxID=644 RepID=UPI001CDBE9D4|nr:hypothetical protein [Aeromonas hydrophila]MCA4698424.1 hypothetical protein [Aeromonas hydrophila]